MTVYVDNARIPATVGRINSRWSHLMADTQDELHAFAASIGLKRSWFQGPPEHQIWHYDVTEGMRWRAIRAGAQPIDLDQCAEVIARQRETSTEIRARIRARIDARSGDSA